MIRNARLQLAATALNNLGVASLVAGVIAPWINGTVGDALHIGAWFIFGAGFFAMAQLLLGWLR